MVRNDAQSLVLHPAKKKTNYIKKYILKSFSSDLPGFLNVPCFHWSSSCFSACMVPEQLTENKDGKISDFETLIRKSPLNHSHYFNDHCTFIHNCEVVGHYFSTGQALPIWDEWQRAIWATSPRREEHHSLHSNSCTLTLKIFVRVCTLT